MAKIDQVIKKCVDDILKEYDKNGDGTIECDELAQFIKKVADL